MYRYTARGGFAHSYVSAEGLNWFTAAGQILHNNFKLSAPLEHKLKVDVQLYTARNQDTDNILKATFDVLQKCFLCQKNACLHKYRIIKNDNLIFDHHVRKYLVKSKAEEKIIIEISDFLEDSENPS